MKAAVLYETGAPLVVEDVDVEAPRDDEVLVRLVAAGVCHSDLSVAQGALATPMPAVLGHEGAGVVERVGAAVGNVAPGDHAILLYRPQCGHCRYCLGGRPALCEQGAAARRTGRLVDGTTRYRVDGREINHFSAASTFAEYAVVPASGVMRVDERAPLEVVAIVGCAVMTGVGAVFNAADVRPGATTAVIGCGGVGLSAVQGCRIAGARRVIAVDVADDKLELARTLGATDVVNAEREDAVGAVLALTGGLGVEFAFETAGTIRTLQSALDCLQPAGMAIAIGVPPLDQELALKPAGLITTDKTLRGSLYGSCNFARDVPLLIDLYLAGQLKLDEMIGRGYPLTAINEALGGLEAGNVARSIVRFE